MNEAFQAKEGLPPDLFPASCPTYTGHYHKPHVVENTNIQYIGSPYQGSPASFFAFPLHSLPGHFSCLQSDIVVGMSPACHHACRVTYSQTDGMHATMLQ